jgi:hypothetical protein
MSTIDSAPTYTLHRELVEAPDGAVTLEMQGFNASGYEKVHVQVVAADGANPSVEVLVWSDTLGKFISVHTPMAFAGKGVDSSYEFTIDALGRRMFVAVTAIAAGTASVYIAGWHA